MAMLAYVTPGSGITPALSPNCPGTHWPFCCAKDGEEQINASRVKAANSGLLAFPILAPEFVLEQKNVCHLGTSRHVHLAAAQVIHSGRDLDAARFDGIPNDGRGSAQ